MPSSGTSKITSLFLACITYIRPLATSTAENGASYLVVLYTLRKSLGERLMPVVKNELNKRV